MYNDISLDALKTGTITLRHNDDYIFKIENGIMKVNQEFRDKQPDDIAKAICDSLEKQWNARHTI